MAKKPRITLDDLAAMTQRGFHEVTDKIEGVKGDLAGVKGDLAGVKNDLAGVKNDLAGVKGDLAGVKNDLVGVKNDLVGVKEELHTHAKTSRREHSDIYHKLSETVSRTEFNALIRRVEQLEAAA